GDDPLRCHEASAPPGGGGPRHHKALGAGKAAFPEPGADPVDPQPVDRQVHGTPGLRARGAQGGVGGGEGMTTTTADTTVTTQVHRVYIKATPEAIWDAITRPEWTERYGYGGRGEFDLRPGGTYRGYTTDAMRSMGAPDVAVEGEVIEADPPRRLVLTWHFVMDPELAAERVTRLTYEIE